MGKFALFFESAYNLSFSRSGSTKNQSATGQRVDVNIGRKF